GAAQRPPCGSPELRRTSGGVGQELEGSAGLCGAHRGNPERAFMSKHKAGLGRVVQALLGGADSAPRRDAMATLPVASIRPGKYQPRTRMDEAALAELAASIRTQGVMQPLLVRPVGRDQYELIAGERRWRAAQLADLTEAPVLRRDGA